MKSQEESVELQVDSLRKTRVLDIWLEATTLVVPELNDGPVKFRDAAGSIVELSRPGEIVAQQLLLAAARQDLDLARDAQTGAERWRQGKAASRLCRKRPG